MVPNLRIISVNINGVSTKLESTDCLNVFSDYDIVCLSEIKCDYPFSMPGYSCLRSRVVPGEEKRGGVAVLFKNSVWDSVCSVQTMKDQVWFSLAFAPDHRFGAVYIAPRDSLYFTQQSFTMIGTQCCDADKRFIILGDLNARMPELNKFSKLAKDASYSDNPDRRENRNGKDIASLCSTCDIMPLNHLNYMDLRCDGGLSFRQGQSWISQLDWALCSVNALQNVSQFRILHDVQLPTNHAAISLELSGLSTSVGALLNRAKMLGAEELELCSLSFCEPITLHRIDISSFKARIPDPDFLWNSAENVDTLCQQLADTLYDTAQCAKLKRNLVENCGEVNNSTERWRKVLENKDSRQLWQSVDWSGSFATPPDVQITPSVKQFCDHYNALLNPSGLSEEYINFQPITEKYIPILDDDITVDEVRVQMSRLRSNKAAGCDGVAPGLLKLLNDAWIMLFTFVFNVVFCGCYPDEWNKMKMFNIHKSGSRLDTSNYRGISIMSAVAKLYDMVLAARFKMWFTPSPEQAGGQSGRCCEEQILIVRLLIDVARQTKRKLFIAFVDYAKAYDKLDRLCLLRMLDSKGCGSRFLRAIKASMKCSTGYIGSDVFQATMGVKQGGCTSCPLFTFYIDYTVKDMQQEEPDSWLGSLHMLLFMDDTAVFATSRKKLQGKLERLKQAADSVGMVVHPSKSKYICVNDSSSSNIKIDEVTISHTESMCTWERQLQIARSQSKSHPMLNQKNATSPNFHLS